MTRSHDVRPLATAELERAKRELQASLALARPGSPMRVLIGAHISAIDTELAWRRSKITPTTAPRTPDGSPGAL